jgi:hypothetical protein
VPALSKLKYLKTLVIFIRHEKYNQVLDFTKFDQIENLKIQLDLISLLNIKFDGCKSLKQVYFGGYHDKIDEDFKRMFNQYNN